MVISFANAFDVKQFVDMFGSVPDLHLVDFASHGAIAEYQSMVKIAKQTEWKLYTVYDRYDDNNGHRMQYIACKQAQDFEHWEIVTVSGYGTEREPFALPENDGKYPIGDIVSYWIDLKSYI